MLRLPITLKSYSTDLGKPVRLVVSKDNYILDGHHRWAAQIGIDAANNRLGDLHMRVSRVNIGIISLLKEAEAFTGGKGHVSAGDNAFGTLFENWDDTGLLTISIRITSQAAHILVVGLLMVVAAVR